MDGYRKRKRQKITHEVEELPSERDTAPQPSKNTAMPHFPIDQLPRDVLAVIFVHCLPEGELWPRIEGKSSQDVAPLLLCNVCSSWRALALSVPRLWQRLFLNFTEIMPKSKETEEAVAMTHKWIKRSGVLPLTLGLRVVALDLVRSVGDFQTLIQALLDALINYACRWEYVELRMCCFPITLPQLGHMPFIRSFSMTALDPGDTTFPFTSGPNLIRVHWPFRCSVRSTPLPWPQLTHIDLGDFTSIWETLDIIQFCPQLTEFKVGLIDDDNVVIFPEGIFDDEEFSLRIVVSKSLQRLELRVYQTCRPLLTRLALPVLTDFSLDFGHESYDEPASTRGLQKDLLDFFSRSKCKLDRLDLRECGFIDAELLKCLEHDSCATLVELRIWNIYDVPMFTDTVLLALTDVPPLKSDALLPRLARLSLGMCFGGSSGSLGAMILSRCVWGDKDHQLQGLYLHCRELDEDDIFLLLLAERQGLEIAVTVDSETENSESTDSDDDDSFVIW